MRPTKIACMVALFSGCADIASLDNANGVAEEGRALFTVVGGIIDYEAIPSAVPAGMTAEEFESRQLTALEAHCVTPRNSNIMLLLNEMRLAVPTDKIRVLEYGAHEANQVEAAFATCGRELGLSASTKERLKDGRETTLAELFRRAIPLIESHEQALGAYARSLDEQKHFWTTVGAAFAAAAGGYAQAVSVNPSQVWIGPTTELTARASPRTGGRRITRFA
jgi:hypothetical protein